MKLALFAGMIIAATAGIARADTISEDDSGVVSISNSASDSDTQAAFFQSSPDALKVGTQSKPVEPFWWELFVGGVFLLGAVVWLLALP